jgi:hypothetical protein
MKRPAIHLSPANGGVENRCSQPLVESMSLTVDQIVEETRQWPEDTVAELVDPIFLAKYGAEEPFAGPAFRAVMHRRVEDIRSGREPGVDGEEVMAKARRIIGR